MSLAGRCGHAARNLIEIRRDRSPTARDNGREWVVMVCKKCKIVKAGYENGLGQFKLSYAKPATETHLQNLAGQRTQVAPQFQYDQLRSKDYRKNMITFPAGDAYRCIICGKPCKNPKYLVWEHLGGGTVVTMEEGKRLNAAGKEGADLGGQPIGSDCLRKHPELRPYVNLE